MRPGSPSRFLEKQSAQVIPVRPAESERSLFVHYDKNGQSWRAPHWASKLDFTGVAWDSAKAGTLIHPQFVVFASHFPRRKGETLVFHDRSGRPVRRKILGRVIVNRIKDPDLTVAMLDAPVPSSIRHYPILPPGHNYRVLNGAPLLVTDKERKVHVFRINRVSQAGYEQIGARPALRHEYGAAWGERLEKGDSGHPAFIILKGRLVLVSTLKGGGWASKGPFFGGQRNQRAMIGAMASLEEALASGKLQRR